MEKAITEKFFFCNHRPYASFFRFSLRHSIICIAFCDFLLGFLNLYRYIMAIILLYQGGQSTGEYLNALSFFIGSLSIIVGFNCIRAALLLKYKYLFHYSVYKQVEFIIQILISAIYEILFIRTGVGSPPIIVYYIVTRVCLYILAKAAWSTYIHIKHGNTFLVIEGKFS